MTKMTGMILVLIGAASLAMAAAPAAAPEIDPTSAIGALAMISGAVLVIRGRRKK